MELGEGTVEGLGICGDSTHITDQAFPKLVSLTFDGLLGKSRENELIDLGNELSIDRAVLKQAYAALATLTLEAGKSDSDEGSLSSCLEDSKWSTDRISCFSKMFLEKKSEVQAFLSSASSSFPHIVDVDWRLDYYIKNNYMDKVNKPNYLITLKTEKCGQSSQQNVQFSCSLEQLQDLVGKLRDACKSVEKAGQL